MQRASTVVGLYNQYNGFSNLIDAAPAGPMSGLGAFGSVLGFVNAWESGDDGRIAYSGLTMINDVSAYMAGSNVGFIADTLGPNALPGLGMLLALSNAEDNPLGVVTAALNFFPPMGPVIGAFISIAAMMLHNEPMMESAASAGWGEDGAIMTTALDVRTSSDVSADPANHAQGWLDRMVGGLQDQRGVAPKTSALTYYSAVNDSFYSCFA